MWNHLKNMETKEGNKTKFDTERKEKAYQVIILSDKLLFLDWLNFWIIEASPEHKPAQIFVSEDYSSRWIINRYRNPRPHI